MAEKELISANEAAKIIGCGAQKVREHMKRGIWDIGDYVPARKLGGTRAEYNVSRRKLLRKLEEGSLS